MGDFTERKYPSYNQYPDTWVAHCAHLRPTTYKVLHLILQFMWINDEKQHRILNNYKTLSRASYTSGTTLRRAMKEILEIPEAGSPLLIVDGKYLISKKLRKEREKYIAVSTQKSSNARGGKSSSGSSAVAQRKTSGSSAIPSPSPDPSPDPDPKEITPPSQDQPKVHKVGPSPTHGPQTLETNLAFLSVKSLAARLERFHHGGDPEWHRWQRNALTCLNKHLPDVNEIIQRAEDATNPTTCRDKGLGEITKPARFITKRFCDLANRVRVKLPEFPNRGAMS